MSIGYEPVFGLDDEALKCPYDSFKNARETCPVSFSSGTGFWVISDHEHITAALKDAVTFSTKEMLGPQVAAEWQMMIDRAAQLPEGKKKIGPDYGTSPRKILLFADPPEHGKHRKLITSALSPAAIKSWEGRIRETAALYVGKLVDGESLDFVEAFATPYTMTVIADILGLPRDEVPQMLEWAEGFNSMVGNPNLTEEQVDGLVGTRLGFDVYFAQKLKERLEQPGTDLISRVAEINEAGESALTVDELLMIIQLTLVGGSDTSSTALAKMIEYLTGDPAEWQRMREDPKHIPAFMDELLRTESPVQGMFRGVTRDVELGGQQLKEGDVVWLSLGAANRDGKVFDDPDAKNMDRRGTAARLVSFGGGPHSCPGTALTRLELRIMLELLTSTFSGVRLTGEQPKSKKSFLFYGPAKLDVAFFA
ncbi:cytochrome P450 [Rhodococcus fascians]|nr:cytochrome P450 [Rhodococcus fascians]MBY4237834.1 cytochrome P450 [Rhodococcus fascians]MBY4253415.1 cytochrome P450 [Rhodococcus fascians]MBY4269052.1 cytochrome P450 [Rhodococcus fascians]MBY4275105.1 cytochrome P450 [Rhodococcus fascians]